MRSRHTRASGCASIAAVGLVAAQLMVLASVNTRYLVVMASVLVLMTAFAAFKLCRDNCVESRLVMASVAIASTVGIALHTTIGLPGVSPHAIGLSGAALLGGALLVLLTITVEARDRHAVWRPRSPYAL